MCSRSSTLTPDQDPTQAAPGSGTAIHRLPFINYMPPEGVEFREHAYVTIPAIGVQEIVVQFKVPKGYNGVINYLANEYVGGGFVQGSGGVTWTIYKDFQGLIPAPNFQLIVASLGVVANPSKLNGIRIKEGQLVTLVVNNVTVIPAGQLIGGLLGGYFYPIDLEPPMTF